MSELPPGWEWATLDELVCADGLFADGDWVESKDQDPDGDVRLIQLADVGDGHFRDRSSRYLTSETAKRLRCSFLQSDDVLIARMPEPLGRACQYSGGTYKAVTVVDVCIFRPGEQGVDTRWLMWWMNTPAVRQRVLDLQTGTTRKRISRGNLSGIRLPVPPLAEQRRIVTALDGHLSHLEAADESLHLILRRAVSLRSSVFSRAVSGDLAEEEVSDTSAVNLLHQITEERRSAGSKGKSPLLPVHESTLAVPDRWVIASLDQLAHRVQYGTSTKTSAEKTATSLPVIRMGNIQNGHLALDNLKYLPADHPDLHNRVLDNGDLLFNRTNSAELVGKSAVYRQGDMSATFASYLIRCQFTQGVAPEWVNLVINSGVGRRYVQSVASQQVGQANVSGTKLRQMPIPLPPTAEQLRIVQRVAETSNFIERVSAQVAGVLRRSQRLRRALLSEAFAGRLVPQDPDDEPASVLLERIKVERAAESKLKRGRRVTKNVDQGSLL